MGATEQRTGRAEPASLGEVSMWLRRRAERKSGRAKAIQPLRLKGLPHEEIRSRLGLTVEEYRRARRWLDDAVDASLASGPPLSVEEALAAHSERQVELVIRFGMLKSQRIPREQIRAQLALSDDGYRLTLEWWRDACSATLAQRRRMM